MMLTKESKLRVLENFYALDYIFFGKPLKENKVCCPIVVEEYLTTKGALMTAFVEMVKEVDHKPKKINEAEKLDSKILTKKAKNAAKHARENSVKILSSDKGRKFVKESVKQELQDSKNVDIDQEIPEKTREAAYKFAVDNLLMARTLMESENVEKLNTWEGRLVEDAYKLLRDSLIESAMVILNYDE